MQNRSSTSPIEIVRNLGQVITDSLNLYDFDLIVSLFRFLHLFGNDLYDGVGT